MPAIWSTPCCGQKDDTIQLELRSDDAIKAERFPYDFVLTSTFRLDGKTVHHTLQVRTPARRSCASASAITRRSTSPLMPAHHHGLRVPVRPAGKPGHSGCPSERPVEAERAITSGRTSRPSQLTDDLFANDSFCMAGLRTKTIGIYEKGTGRKITCNVEGYPYALIWSAPAKPVRFVCIEPWHSPARRCYRPAGLGAARRCRLPCPRRKLGDHPFSTTFDR